MTKNKLILGTVQMGLDYGISNPNGQISTDESFKILEMAYDRGLRVLDTAEAYGNAHEVIGGFHAKYANKKFKIITKLPHKIDDKIESKVAIYLKQLNVSKLEALLFHNFETYERNKGALKPLSQLKENGLVDKIGVSIYTNEQMIRVIDDPLINVIQLPFNILDNIQLRGELILRAKEAGKEVHTRSCYLQGLIFQEPSDKKKIVKLLKKELIEIKRISNRYNCSIQQLALNYCLQQTSIDRVLIGVDNSEQFTQNIELCEKGISDEIVRELNMIQVSDVNLLNPSLWNSL